MKKKQLVIPALAIAMIAGAVAGFAGMVSAQTTTSAASAVTPSTNTMAPPLRGPHIDGTVTAVNGTTITLTEESKEGGAVYTVDASGAAVRKNGAASTLSTVAVGDKIFVNGAASGANVAATSINDGMPQGGPGRGGMGRGPGRGIMGTVSSVNGSAITVTGKDGTTYTVDAGNAAVEKVVSSSVSDIAIGDTIGVQGSVSGTTATATTIMDGQPFGK